MNIIKKKIEDTVSNIESGIWLDTAFKSAICNSNFLNIRSLHSDYGMSNLEELNNVISNRVIGILKRG